MILQELRERKGYRKTEIEEDVLLCEKKALSNRPSETKWKDGPKEKGKLDSASYLDLPNPRPEWHLQMKC